MLYITFRLRQIRISSVGFVAFTDKDLDTLQIGGTIYWGPPPEITYNQAVEPLTAVGRGRKAGTGRSGEKTGENRWKTKGNWRFWWKLIFLGR